MTPTLDEVCDTYATFPLYAGNKRESVNPQWGFRFQIEVTRLNATAPRMIAEASMFATLF